MPEEKTLMPAIMQELTRRGWAREYPNLGVLVQKMLADNQQYTLTLNGDYYDDDDAFEFVSEALIQAYKFEDEAVVRALELVNDFLEALEVAQESLGLIEWQ